MKQEDKEFLKNLQHEMLTQDTVCQANPRFWVIMQTVKDYWVGENTDGIFVYSPDDAESVFEGEFSDVVKWLKTLKGIKKCRYEFSYIELKYKEDEWLIDNADELQEFLNENFKGSNYFVGYYREREEIVQNTMFLTLRECKNHIEYNQHHYNKTAHPYAMTAWRSPQVARLYEILEKTDWENM